MLPIADAREVVRREIAQVVSRLAAEPDDVWRYPVRCRGWSVGDLAAHLAWGQALEADALGKMSRAETQPARALTPAADRQATLAAIEANNVVLLRALGALTPEEVEAGVCPLPLGPLPGQLAVQLFAVEAGVHANDLSWALGDHVPLPTDVAAATATVVTAALPLMSQAASHTPDANVAYRITGDSVRLHLRYDGDTWDHSDQPTARTTQISGDDSAVLLFVMGRIAADDSTLRVEGDGDPAESFKLFFPGP